MWIQVQALEPNSQTLISEVGVGVGGFRGPNHNVSIQSELAKRMGPILALNSDPKTLNPNPQTRNPSPYTPTGVRDSVD